MAPITTSVFLIHRTCTDELYIYYYPHSLVKQKLFDAKNSLKNFLP